MRGTEGYTGRYVWNCPYCSTWGGREEGLRPLAYTEKTLFWIWPLEFVRHILEVRLYQTGSGTNSPRPFRPHKQRWCLPWTAVSNQRPKFPSAFGRFLFTHWKWRVSCVRVWMTASQHSRVPGAPLGPKWRSPLCPQTCFGRRLSIIGRKNPLCPSPFPLSSSTCPIGPPGTLGTEWMVLVRFCF